MDFQLDKSGLAQILEQAQERANAAFNDALNREAAGASTIEEIEQAVLRASAEVFGEPMDPAAATSIARSVAEQAGIPTDQS